MEVESLQSLMMANGSRLPRHATELHRVEDVGLDQAIIESERWQDILNACQADLTVLGRDQKLLSVNWLEPSTWSNFASVTVESSDEMQKTYFLKACELRFPEP